MSSSLDKLRALTSRLEEKLESKKSEETHKKVETSQVEAQKEETPKAEVPSVAQKEETVVPAVSVPPVTAAVPVKQKTGKNESFEDVRSNNIERVEALYKKLRIFEKSPDFNNIFMYKAMNLSGIGLKEEDFAEVREGKYIQVIAITYEPDKNGKKKAKNISLGYFGKAETLDGTLKNEIIEFVLRWRYEKAFQNVEHYKDLIARVDVPSTTLF